MKVILIQDVKSQGKKDDVIEVNDGYARNFLIKNKLAIEATNSEINKLNNKKSAEAFRAAQEKKKAEEEGNLIKDKTFTIYQKTGSGDKLFGSVTAKEIAEVIKKDTGIEVDKKKIVLAEPIKTLGEYKADVRLHVDIHVNINIVIAQKDQ